MKKLKVDRHQLKRIIQELKKWKAPATVLLTLYIPPGRPISDVLSMLRQEYAITDNIKLKRTRAAVQRALAAAMERLSKIPKTPENGLAVFCGEDMDTKNFICWIFSPPEKVPVYFYRTDKYFHTEFLEDMVTEKDLIGLIIVERDAATIGLLKGSRLEVLKELEGYVPGKHHKGGQSQRRFDRIIEQMVMEFYKKVAEYAKKLFEPYINQGKLKGILIGGPAYAKYDFLEGDYLDYRLKKLVIPKLIDVAYQGEAGLREMVRKASDILKDIAYVDAYNAIEEFKLHLVKDDGMIVYGIEEVKNALQMGAVKTLLIDENREDALEWIELAKKYGAKPTLISDDIPEAQWLKKTFGGVVGILRYRIY